MHETLKVLVFTLYLWIGIRFVASNRDMPVVETSEIFLEGFLWPLWVTLRFIAQIGDRIRG